MKTPNVKVKKPDGDKLLHDLTHVASLLRAEYTTMDAEDLATIRPVDLAARVLKLLDPKERASVHVRALAHATLVHMAGSLCANTHRTEQAASEQQMTISVFDAGLQPRYPVGDGYKKRSLMTKAELRANAARLRAEGEAKMAHADALDAETDEKEANDYFDDDGVPRCVIRSAESAS
jgi:regulator of protease activity HflC (stomatin/prohibitin superfamily)